MPRLAALAALAVCLITITTAHAQTVVAWKFDRPIFIDVTHDGSQTVNVMGNKNETKTSIRFLFEVRLNKANADGSVVLDVTAVDCKDRSAEKGGEDDGEVFKGFVGVKFPVTLGPRNASIDVGDAEKIAAAAFGDDYKNGDANEKQFVRDVAVMVLKSHLYDALVPTPAKPVSPGDAWSGPTEIKVEPFARLTADRRYTLDAKQPDPAKLAITWKSALNVQPAGQANPAIPFKIKELKLADGSKYDGAVVWDPKLGRPTRVESEQSYQMQMTMESADGKLIKGDGGGTDKFTITLSNENPDAKK